MIDQPSKVGEYQRVVVLDRRMQDPAQPTLTQLLGPRVLVHEQRKLGGKADVGQRDTVSDERFPLRRQRLLKPRAVDRERLLGAPVNRRIDRVT